MARTKAAGGGQMRLQDRRAGLIEAALRVMKRDGVAAATTRAITAEAGMPHGAFHYCFDSKQHLMSMIFAKDRDTVAEHAFPEHLDPARPLRDVLADALNSYWQVVRADPDEQMVLQELTLYALRDPELRDLPRADLERHHTQLARALERAAEQLRLHWSREPAVLAAIMFAGFNGLIISWLCTRDDDTAQRCLGELADHIASQARPGR